MLRDRGLQIPTKHSFSASVTQMKKVIICLLIIWLVQCALSQQVPLTQAEYVKMLYALQKDPSGKAQIVEALRARGIDFPVTDGLRSLTRSKAANDEELKQ